MNNISRCPECHSTDIKVFESYNRYNCNVCGFSFTEQEFKKLRIFLSYGHDNNEELVRRIKTDLENRGHDVWFDKTEIKFGDEWRRSITDGILSSNRVLSFLSKHSTRDPGVCRDEIAIAIGVKGGNIQTILVESEQEVQPPVNIGHIQWLDMHDWKERRDAGEAAWEQWYQTKLAEIVRVVESDESRRFSGEIETLNGHLKPIKSEARICQLLSKGFYGRQWLFEAVEKWRCAGSAGLRPDSTEKQERAGSEIGAPSRLFWIMGDPGVGKSAFVAQLTHTRGDTIIAAQFCEWDKSDHRDARRVVCSIAFQLATRLPDYRKFLLTLPEITELNRKNASELFDYLLANPLRSVIDGGRERYLIVIDALDEAGENGRNPLVEILAQNANHLPAWLGFVVTSRPEFDVKTPFQALIPLPLDTKSESNRADIRDYLFSKLVLQLKNRPDAEKLIEKILEKSEGVFLYIERFCDDVLQKHISLDHPDKFPQGLGGIFAHYFQRQFSDIEKFRKVVRPALRAILAAREPLPIEILQKLFIWQDEELRDFTNILGSLFQVTKEAENETIKPYHKSLSDWLSDEAKAGAYFVSVMEGHRMLANFCSPRWQASDSFSLTNLVYHLHNAGQFDELAKIIFNLSFHQLKSTVYGGSYDDLLLSEVGAKGRLGLTSAICFALRVHVNDPLFHTALGTSAQWKHDGVSVKACTIFSLQALESFQLEQPESIRATAALRIYLEAECNSAILDGERAALKATLTRAKLAQRKAAEPVNSHTVQTAHFYEDYVELSLDAIDAALALEPGRLVVKLSAAHQFKAACDCDGDPMWRFNSVRVDAIKEVNTRLSALLHPLIALNSSEVRNLPVP